MVNLYGIAEVGCGKELISEGKMAIFDGIMKLEAVKDESAVL